LRRDLKSNREALDLNMRHPEGGLRAGQAVFIQRSTLCRPPVVLRQKTKNYTVDNKQLDSPPNWSACLADWVAIKSHLLRSRTALREDDWAG